MNHHIFGELQYDYVWRRDYQINIFSETTEGKLNIYGEEGEDIENIQVDAFLEFEKNKSRLCDEIEQALYNYYQNVVMVYREKYGKSADTHAPIVNNIEDMKMIVKFEALNLPYSFVENERVVGVIFQAKWEKEHGVAVKIVNGEIADVGYQDIVL